MSDDASDAPVRLVVDTSSLTYRAFHALPASIRDRDGHAVNAVRGYLDMVANVVTSRPVRDVLHVMDDAEQPAERLAAYPGYKADRTAPPEDIVGQFELLESVLAALGETIVRASGWEADDGIGALCVEATPDDPVAVLTGDRDLIQLVRDPAVRVLYTLSGTKNLAELDEAAVMDTYGIPAHRYADYATLRGDAADGLPGVRGVGKKTAQRLVSRYADLDALLADAAAQTPKLAQTLRDAAGYLQAMKAVVPIRTDVAIDVAEHPRDLAAVERLRDRHSLSGPVERYLEARP